MQFVEKIITPNRFTVMFAGICALMLTMGIARHAFTPMIPFMHEQTGMSESLSGWLAGWSYIGYLTGLFIVWLIRDLKLKDYFYRYALFLAVFSTIVMAMLDHSLIWYISRFFAGISTAFGFMLGTGLVLKWLVYNKQKEEMGLHFAGIGLGIVLSALAVDFAAEQVINYGLTQDLQWRAQWLFLAAIGLLLSIPACFLMPLPKVDEIKQAAVTDRSSEPSTRWLKLLTIAYICAGCSNTVNITFTSLITEYIPLEKEGTTMWFYLGLAAIPAPFIWDRIARSAGYLNAIRAAFVVNIFSNLIITMLTSYTAMMISSILFGFAFMGIVSLTLTIIANKYKHRATQVMAQLTLGYCLSQIIAPIVAGYIAEATGSFNIALGFVSGIMIIGIICLGMMNRE